jgi:DNA mismatch repair protein MutS
MFQRPFPSVLFGPDQTSNSHPEPDEPEYFADLNLGQIVGTVIAGRTEYRLAPLFHTPLDSVDAISYRHEVMRDLRRADVRGCVTSFADEMRSMREHLTQSNKLYYPRQKKSWWFDATRIYVRAVWRLVDDLDRVSPRSRGLLAIRGHLHDYATSAVFTRLGDDARKVQELLATVIYRLHIAGNRVTVTRYDGEVDYGDEVVATFERFKRGEVKSYRAKFSNYAEMNHVEAQVLDCVARLYPDVFAAMDRYRERHRDYLDPSVAAFDREIQFYLAYLEHIERLEQAGLAFCFPEVSERSKHVFARDTFDLALADKLVIQKEPVVRNDFHLVAPERIFVVSGPNQGGKTTFARAFGQLHYLARLGLPIPGSSARTFLFDRMFSHFERGENLRDLHGELQDDLLRIHAILDAATPRSVVVINEIFNSTALDDAVWLGTKVLEQLIRLDLLCVCVTFIDELASLGASTVSVASTVDPGDPAIRTYKLERKPADGLAYALAVAEKYRLTYDMLLERVEGATS